MFTQVIKKTLSEQTIGEAKIHKARKFYLTETSDKEWVHSHDFLDDKLGH